MERRTSAFGALGPASAIGAGLLVLAAVAALPAAAQQAPPPASSPPPAAETAEPAVPKNVLAGLLAEGDQSAVLIRSFLAGEGSDPDAISRRAVELVESLKQSGLVADPGVLALAAQKVARAASETLAAAPVLQLKVDKSFETLPPGVKAFDFGPPDKAPVNGFERVLPGDPMLAGRVRGLRRPGDEAGILSGGVAGVQTMKVALPDGEYRVTLLTEAIGDAAMALAPFGEMINANGQQIRVSQAPPDQWSRMTVLSNQGLAGADSASGAGGAVTIVVRVVGGQLNLGFNFSNRNLQTYLTGMVVEPMTQPSIFARTPDAPPLRPDTENRLRQEANLMAALVTAAQPTGQPLTPAQNTRPSASPS